jgi:hypothetical protein
MKTVHSFKKSGIDSFATQHEFLDAVETADPAQPQKMPSIHD